MNPNVVTEEDFNSDAIAAKKLDKKDWIYIRAKGMNISSSLIRKF